MKKLKFKLDFLNGKTLINLNTILIDKINDYLNNYLESASGNTITAREYISSLRKKEYDEVGTIEFQIPNPELISVFDFIYKYKKEDPEYLSVIAVLGQIFKENPNTYALINNEYGIIYIEYIQDNDIEEIIFSFPPLLEAGDENLDDNKFNITYENNYAIIEYDKDIDLDDIYLITPI